MFLGHFAVGFAGKKVARRSNVAVLIAAALFLDLLWPVFLMLGWEQVRMNPGVTNFKKFDFTYYPWSHSLLMSVVWASAFALLYFLISRYRPGAIAVWICVISHWVLDWISHRPDLPLYPGGSDFGLGLWNSVAATMVVELLMFAVGLWLYLKTTRARDGIGLYAFLAYIIFLLMAYVGDRFSGPPPSVANLVWASIIAEVILITWAWWFDRHRDLRT
jgi:hypothetical protein